MFDRLRERIGRTEPWAIRCRWMFPVDDAPTPGLLTVVDGVVAAVGRNDSAEPPVDLGDVAILPPLVNAHTHLELTDIQRPLGRPGMRLPDWIRLVIDRKRRVPPSESLPRRRAAVDAGLQASAACGVDLIGDIVNPPWSPDWLDGGCHVVAFREVLSLDEAGLEPLTAELKRHVQRSGGDWTPGASPHAPYSTRLDLVRRAAAMDAPGGVAMHLAESPEELELLRTNRGPFRDMLESLGAWREGSIQPGTRVLDYLGALASARRALVIHGNYLDADEMEFLGGRRDRLTVVYCPRTHAYFQHAPYPLANMLQRGIRVVLGTDSRASTPDLNILRDFRAAVEAHSDVPIDRLLPMVSTEAARALGAERGLAGSAAARLTVVPVTTESGDPHRQLLEGGEPQRLESLGSDRRGSGRL